MLNALSYNGFELSNTNPISLLWTKCVVGNPDIKFMNSKTKINHFPGSQYLGRKDLFHETINSSKLKSKLTP